MCESTCVKTCAVILLPGIVIAASGTKCKATRLAVQCKTCRSVKYLPLGGGFSGVQVPRVCDQSQAGRGEERLRGLGWVGRTGVGGTWFGGTAV